MGSGGGRWLKMEEDGGSGGVVFEANMMATKSSIHYNKSPKGSRGIVWKVPVPRRDSPAHQERLSSPVQKNPLWKWNTKHPSQAARSSKRVPIGGYGLPIGCCCILFTFPHSKTHQPPTQGQSSSPRCTEALANCGGSNARWERLALSSRAGLCRAGAATWSGPVRTPKNR